MFEQHEESMREQIKKAHAPVLGLLGGLIPTEARGAIQEDIHVSPGAKWFAKRLDLYPALFGVWLAEHVMHGLGTSGHFDVYPHIQKALGGSAELNSGERELLWRAFRRGMLKLGIQPLPRTFGNHYMINEYARQAGVPLAFADDLALKMLLHAKRLGLPDEDDQEGLLTWQSSLLNKLQPPFSATARKAIERDAHAYYTRTFLRVYANHGCPMVGDALEAALARSFAQEGGAANIKRAAIPQLLYRDGVIGILFQPTRSPAQHELRCGADSLFVRTDEEGGFRQLLGDLPGEAQVFNSEGERVLNVKLWPDRASNRLLIFNEAGRLRASAQLGQAEAVELAPGRYVALCRFTPTNTDEWVEVSEDPQLVEVPFDVRPGLESNFANGSVCVAIAGQNLPSFRLDGKAKAGLEQVEFYHGSLVAKVEIPPDWRQAGQQGFELRVTSGASSCQLPLPMSEDGTGCIEIQDAFLSIGLKPGLQRLVIELARAGDARILQRQSILYWIGLSNISYGLCFTYSQRPQNLVASACSGIKFNDLHAEPGNDLCRVLRLGFDVGGGRLIHLSWNRPGVFVDVEVPGRDGTMTHVSRPLGSTETVSLTNEKNIIVSASEPGFISLGEWRQFVDFSHRPSKVLSASFLASRLEPGARTLTYETQGGATVPLLVLSQPHVATAVATSRLANVFEIRVTLQGEPTEIAVTGKGLSHGRESRVEHELMAGEWRTNDLARMQAYSAPALGKHVVHVLIDTHTLPEGVWTLGFGARIGGVWGRLEDAQEGRIAVAFAVNQLGQDVPGHEIISGVVDLEIPEAVARLGRLTDHFRQLWSPSCWEQQAWLTSYWSALIDRVRGHEQRCLAQLLDMAMAIVPDDVRQGFLPKQSVGAKLPAIFAMQRAEYRRVNVKHHALSPSLRAMPEFTGGVVKAFGSTIHQVVALSFQNPAEIMRGLRPKGFQLGKYEQSLRQTSHAALHMLDDAASIPAAGELLGPQHLAHAWRDLDRGYATSMLMPSQRKALALALSRALHQRTPKFDDSAPAGLRGHRLVLQLEPFADDGVDEAEQQRVETVCQIANACAWFAWHCRLDVLRPGSLASFLDRLAVTRRTIEIPGHGVADCLAYLLHVAPAMFSYYLLLWELVLTVELDPEISHV